ncbi:ATPase PAAT [Orycteropus afer afer]|uniref:ATPase PAAT n=1 Tax=Orycteropus afer afer TaxID=1230840 RepID=A0AC54Z124_ORYAF|nr:ATPase PAAT [Orycteropus afer afer]
MEAGTEDPGLTRRPTLASSWDAPCGALTQNLFLSRGGLGAGEFDWEELLAPPAQGQELVNLKRILNNQDENPCFLYLACDPNGGEEIDSIGVLSSARNMEVYLGEEYCGTSRGKTVCTVLDNSGHEIILYKKYLKLESSTQACKVKMELMEKNLTDYIDQRISKLQEHIDDKLALLVDLLQNSNSLSSGMPLRQYDSGERLSNGER